MFCGGLVGRSRAWPAADSTRSGWYDAMHSRLPSPPRRLTDLEREVRSMPPHATPRRLRWSRRSGCVQGARRDARVYDDLRRRDSSVDDFERVLVRELERDAEDDLGAARLLKQTRFLAAAFRGYETRRDATGAVDEYALRTTLLNVAPTRPLRQVVLTVGERSVDSAGLWPADLALLTQLPLLEQIDIIATHATIAAGLLDRLEKFMPGFEEGEMTTDPDDVVGPFTRPVLVAASDTQPFTVSRDREDELSSIAAAVKTTGSSDLARRAVVFKRPRRMCISRATSLRMPAIQYQTFDALPWRGAVRRCARLIFEFVTSNFTREPVVALLGRRNFSFEDDGAPIRRPDVAAESSAQRRRVFRWCRQPAGLRALERGEGRSECGCELRAMTDKARRRCSSMVCSHS